MQQAKRVADTTAFFSVDMSKGGRTGYLVEMGPTQQIFENPQREAHQGLHRRTVQLSGGRVMNLRRARRGCWRSSPARGSSWPASRDAQTSAGGKVVLQGAGATFPAPLYKKWIGVFTEHEPGVAIEYKDVGSGEGVKRFLAQTGRFRRQRRRADRRADGRA